MKNVNELSEAEALRQLMNGLPIWATKVGYTTESTQEERELGSQLFKVHEFWLKLQEDARRYVSQAHVRDLGRKEVHRHLKGCPHFYDDADHADPELRPATDEELRRTKDEHGRVWRNCKDCDRTALRRTA